MDFDKLIEYQTIDRKLVKIEYELNKSEEKKRAAKFNSMMKNASENMAKLNGEADELIKNIDKTISNIGKYEEGISEIDKHIGDLSDLNEVEFYEKKLAEISDEISKLEKDLLRLNSRIDYVKESSERLTMQAVQINSQYKKAFMEYAKLRKKLSAEGKPYNDKLKQLEKEIPPKFIEIYKRCRNSKKLPAFVEYKEYGTCYCGMNLPNNCISKLKKSGDMVECPNCGRVVIVK